MSFTQKLKGAIYGVAIGDAMGAPVEGWASARIIERFNNHDFSAFIPPTHRADPAKGKGAGRITDDTLMTEILINAYIEAKCHLDAYAYCSYIFPAVKERTCWIPEWQAEGQIWNRLWFPEQYPRMRLVPANAEPRTAGAVNAGCPRCAYQEAVLIGSAHNESFAVEAGAVMAAASAEALSISGTIESVLDVSCSLAKDGTRRAIYAAVAASNQEDTLHSFIDNTRAAVASFINRRTAGGAFRRAIRS